MATDSCKRLHPASRLAGLLAALVALTAFNDPRFVAPPAAAAVAVGLLGCGAWPAFRRAAPLALALLTLSVLLWPPFIKDGAPLAQVWLWRATDAGVLYGLAVGLRICGMLAAGLAFLAATTPEEFSDGLRAFRVPAAATVTLSLAFRLLPVVFDSSARAMEAQRARGLAFGNNFFSQARRALPLVVPVFLYSLRSADQLATSLELRGYRASGVPTAYPPRRFGARDRVFTAAAWLAAAAAVGARLAGEGAVLPGRI